MTAQGSGVIELIFVATRYKYWILWVLGELLSHNLELGEICVHCLLRRRWPLHPVCVCVGSFHPRNILSWSLIFGSCFFVCPILSFVSLYIKKWPHTQFKTFQLKEKKNLTSIYCKERTQNQKKQQEPSNPIKSKCKKLFLGRFWLELCPESSQQIVLKM